MKKRTHGILGGNLEDVHMRGSRTLNQLRQVKTYGYRAPDDGKEFAPDAPGDEGEGVGALLQSMIRKIDMMDAKLEFLLQQLEDTK